MRKRTKRGTPPTGQMHLRTGPNALSGQQERARTRAWHAGAGAGAAVASARCSSAGCREGRLRAVLCGARTNSHQDPERIRGSTKFPRS